MKRLSALTAFAVCTLFVLPSVADQKPDDPNHGINLGDIKTYDEKSLEDLLKTAINNLGLINAFDSGVTKQLGTLQGATLNQTSVSLTGGTASPPSQSGPAAPTLPTNSVISAGDFLSQELQLGLQIINTQLLLRGSLNDQSPQGDVEHARMRVTIGFPIVITVPPGSKYREAVADVQISICSFDAKPVSLGLLLPQEKTYNVASLVSKSASFGGAGTIAGVVNLGGSFLHGHQTYFVVQDQDTLAMQRPDDTTACTAPARAVTFAWQFRPVLGQKVVRNGTRQTFAQLSVPTGITGNLPRELKVKVLTSWRRYDIRTGQVGGRIDKPDPRYTRVSTFSLPPSPFDVSVQDNGDGNLTVLAQGGFRPTTRVRIGATTQDSTAPNFEQNDRYIRFVASALNLATVGASLLNGDGTEWPIFPRKELNRPESAPNETAQVGESAPCPVCEPAPQPVPRLTLSVKSGDADETLTTEFRIRDELTSPPDVDCRDQKNPTGGSCSNMDRSEVALTGLGHVVRLTFHISRTAPSGTWEFTVTSNGKILGSANFVVNPVTVRPFKDGSSLVRVQLADRLPYDPTNPDVIVIGSKAFGLRDTPYYERTPDHATALVSNDLITTYRSLTWRRFLDLPSDRVAYAENLPFPIPFSPPSAAGASDFSVTSITPITAASSPGDSSKGVGDSSKGGTGSTVSAPVFADVVVGIEPGAYGDTITGKGLLALGDGTPALVSFSPSSGQRGETVTDVMITGAFTTFRTTSPTSLISNDPNVTGSVTVVDDTHLKASINIREKAEPGPVTITVISGAAGAKPVSGVFTVGDAKCTVTDVVPDHASANMEVTITGDDKTHFSPDSVVQFSDATISTGKVTWVASKPHELKVRVTIKPESSGRSDVKVITGAEAAIGTGRFTANPQKPSVLRIDPAGVKPGQTPAVTVYISGADFATPPKLQFGSSGISAPARTVDSTAKDQLHATLEIPPAAPQKPSNRFAISGVRLSSLRIVEPAVEPDFQSDTLVIFGLTDDQVKQYKNLVLQYGQGQRMLQPLNPPTPTPPARSLTAQPKGGIPATQTSVPISGNGMTQVVAIRYNDQALSFSVDSDTKLTLQLIAPQTLKTVLAAPAIVVVVEYYDKSLVPYSIPVSAASK